MQEEHHTGNSILEELPIGLVSQVPFEYMHLVCLGVTRKLLKIWICASVPLRIPGRQVIEISNALAQLKPFIVKEFSRKPRSLKEIDRWKATEFRQLLLYTGPIVFSSLPKKYYQNFMTLHCAISILCTPGICRDRNDYACKLQYFVKGFCDMYGKTHISYNVHELLHLAKDVKKFGPLDDFSAFPFENHMQFFRANLRKFEKPLQQISNRISEKQSVVGIGMKQEISSQVLFGSHSNGPLLPESQAPQFSKANFLVFKLK